MSFAASERKGINKMRRKWSWTEQNMRRSETVREVLDELKRYQPLTVRQVFYRLLARGYFLLSCWTKRKGIMLSKPYTALCTLLKWMRIDDHISWNTLEDRTRYISDKRGFEDIWDFIDQEKKWVLNGYERCLIQGQDKYVEVWVEKDALGRVFIDITDKYCIRTVVNRGFQSVTFTADFYRRATQAMKHGQEVVVLYFGDLDPSGVSMFEAAIKTITDELGLTGIEYKRVALTPKQVIKYDLPTDPTAAKPSDTRYKKYAQKYGTLAVELDALHPEKLRQIAKDAIESEIDMELYETQKELEMEDLEIIKSFREKIVQVFDNLR
jgi:hypothetical protein